jgi:hypothetical protein
MAYTPATLSLIAQGIGGKDKLFAYRTTDVATDVDASDYFSDGVQRGMTLGSVVAVIETDNASPYLNTWQQVSVVDSDGNSTTVAAA